jgi:hypothetical protein
VWTIKEPTGPNVDKLAARGCFAQGGSVHSITLTLSLVFVASCLQIGGSETTDGGAAPVNPNVPGDANDEGWVDTGCVVDSVSGISLCTRISLCPGLAVDHDVYPDCGFRGPSASIDIQCICGDFVCPLGVALSCAEAAALMASQSEIFACTQASEGRCALRRPANPGGGSCDKACAASCAGDPGCYRICGC